VIPPLDIFKLEPDGQLVWKGTAEDFITAKSNVKVLATNSPGDYVIYIGRQNHRQTRYRRELVRLVARSEEHINYGHNGFGHRARANRKIRANCRGAACPNVV
jgi:hypothetical protein